MTEQPATAPPGVAHDLPATPGPQHPRMTSELAGWLVDALRVHAMGERISWDAAFLLAPHAQGPQPVFVVYLQMPSPLVGQLLVEMVLLEPRAVTEDQVRTQTAEAVARLVRARSQTVAGLN